MTKQQWRELIKRTKIASKKYRLTKKERIDIAQGIIKMEELGIFNKPNWAGGRK